MEHTQVVIAGAGPTGLMLACELRLAGIDVVVLEAAQRRSGESRAGGLHARTMEILDQRGIIDRFLAEGRRVAAAHFSGLWLDLSALETRYPYVLGLVQTRIEALLEQRLAQLGAQVAFSSEVVGFDETDVSIVVDVRGSGPIRADYLVGCDGGRSTVRTLAGIGFAGTEATVTSMLADVELRDPPSGPVFQRRRPDGDFTVLQFEPGWYRLMINQFDHVVGRDVPIDFATFRDTFVRIAGADYGMHSPRWVSRYSDAARLADRYRTGRVLLAGDAAHIHWPSGGQGLNTGVQDAANLGWKLAMVLNGHIGDELLDTYEQERRPVAQRVLDNTRAQTVLGRPGAHTDALRDTMSALIAGEPANRYLAGMVTGLDIGLRAPQVPLPDARGVLLAIPSVLATAAGWVDRVELVASDEAPMLVRPDGYVAWSGGPGLSDALGTWFGAAAS